MTAPCRILVVDDDDDLRESMVDALVDTGHTVSSANNGAEALRLLGGGDVLPDLILLDLMMPVMDGVEFRARQRSDDRLRSIPVVVLSADAAIGERAAEMQVTAHCRKPVTLHQLYELVTRWCGSPRG